MRKSRIEKAKNICKAELNKREHEFKDDFLKRREQVKEMQLVIDVLNECKKSIPDEQGDLFPSKLEP